MKIMYTKIKKFYIKEIKSDPFLIFSWGLVFGALSLASILAIVGILT